MRSICEQTGELISLNFKKKGWLSSKDYYCEGNLFDKNGQKIYELIGLWNEYLEATKYKKDQFFEVGRKLTELENEDMQYYFSNFAMNLNHITLKMSEKLPRTDARLRTD